MKKNYFKLIGSILMVLCMVVTVGLTAIRTEAEGTQTASVAWRADVTYEADNTAPSTPTDLSGYIFGGWYKNTGSAEAPVYTPVREPVLNEKYVAKWVPAEVLGIQAQISNNIVKEDTKTQDNNKIRFVTSIDSTAYSEIGFEIKKGDGTAEIVDTTNKVFSKLYYIDAASASEEPQSVDAGSLFCQGVSQYFKTYTITSIPDTVFDTDITVRAYWKTLDGTQVFGTKAIKTVNYGRSWYYVDAEEGATTNSEAPVGTYSNPYTTLTDAVAVETKLNPKLILKSDVTVEGTVNVARTMTIEGFESARTITCNIDNTNKNTMIGVAEEANLTLNKLNLNGGYYVVKSTNATVTANNVEIQDGGYYGFQIIGGTAELNDVKIAGVTRGVRLESGATVTGETLNIVSPAQGISCASASTFDYNDLTISGNTGNAINVFGNSTAIVNGGEIKNATGNGLNVAGAKAATLIGVDIKFADNAIGGYGINVYPENNVVPEVTLVDVNVTDAGEHGIALRNGATGSYKGGTVSGSKGKGIYLYDSAEGTNGASITLEGVNITNSTSENLYADHGSTATINGELTTEGGTHSLYIVNSSKIQKGDTYSKITIDSPANNGIYLYNEGSILNVGNMEIKGCGAKGIEVNQSATATLSGTVQVENSTAENLYLHNKSTVTVDGTLNMTGGNTYSLAVYGASIVDGDTNNSQITIATPKSYGVRIADENSLLKVDNMTLTNCQHHGIYIENKGQARFNGSVSIQGASTGNYDCLYVTGASSQATVNGTITTTGGRHGLAIFNGGVVKGNDNSAIEITSPRTDGVNIYNAGSELYADDMTLTSCGHYGVYMGNDQKGGSTKVTLTGDVKIQESTGNAFFMELGTLEASNINIKDAGAYGFRANGGTATIQQLDIDGVGATTWSAVYVQGDATNVTINGGTIKNINKHGVNVKTKATLTMRNCTVIDIGLNISDGHEIINECKYANISLENCNISTEDIYLNTGNCKCTEE